jgi:hypothetical protein
VELRGLEPLTPTLPGTGRSRDQARYVHFGAVGDVVEGPTVVTVVVTVVVNDRFAQISAPAHEISSSPSCSLHAVWADGSNDQILLMGERHTNDLGTTPVERLRAALF